METKDINAQLLLDIEKLKAPEGYLNAGLPNYNTLFGRDSIISAWQLLPIYPKIAKTTLFALAKRQATRYEDAKDSEPGKILHEHRFDLEKQKQIPNWDWPYYGSVDATSLFLILLDEYERVTGDQETVRKLWPCAIQAVRWHCINAARNPFGFITYQRRNPRGLFHQGWKDSAEDHLKITPPVAIVEEQGYVYKACKGYVELAKRVSGVPLLSISSAEELASNIKSNFSAHFWLEKEQYFALGLDGQDRPRKAITSNPGHLLLCEDFIEEHQARAIVRRLFQKDICTIGGIRTLSAKDPDFDPFSYHLGSVWPHDNWMIYKGLRQWGFMQEAQKIKEALLLAHKVLGGIPECYAVIKGFLGREKIVPIRKLSQLEANTQKLGEHLASFTANPLQAWAIGALINMLYEE